jgi:hypothetical protein
MFSLTGSHAATTEWCWNKLKQLQIGWDCLSVMEIGKFNFMDVELVLH